METRFLAVGASVVALTEASAYASDDDGASWRTLVLPAGAGKIRKVVESGDRWLALSERAHLYESADGGRRWRRFGAALSRRFAPDEARLESFGFHRARPDVAGIVLRDGGRRAATVTLPVSPAARSA